MQDLAEESGGGPADFPRDFPAGDERNQSYGSYNSRINTHARNSCGSFIDEHMIPPEGSVCFLTPEDFLNNFDFFAMNVGKMYTDAHPRNY